MHTSKVSSARSAGPAVLAVEGLDVRYGSAHVLQSVSLTLDAGVLAVVGRNGMGKTTLCRAITGNVSFTGSIKFLGQELRGLPADEITKLGVAWVPQGRRVWRSLTVDETLKLAARTARRGAWTVDRVYGEFPRLAERRRNGGTQLSGGEQQMLAIGRALLFNPRLLVMDEPTEGLAPVIVEHVATMLRKLADEGSISILLIEQNLGVALEVADRVAVMVNGRVAHTVASQTLADDRALQQRLLGLQSGAADTSADSSDTDEALSASQRIVLRVRRAIDSESIPPATPKAATPPEVTSDETSSPGDRAVYLVDLTSPSAAADELRFIENALASRSISCRVVSLGEVASRMRSVPEVTRHLLQQRGLASVVAITSRGQELAAAQLVESLPATVPRFVLALQGAKVETTQAFVVRTVSGRLNRAGETVLDQMVDSLGALVQKRQTRLTRPAVCVTTLEPASAFVRQIEQALATTHDCIVVQMDAAGLRSIDGLVTSGLLSGFIDLAPTDAPVVAVVRGQAQVTNRFTSLAAAGIPYIGVAAMLDVLHFPKEADMPTEFHARPVARVGGGAAFSPITPDEAVRIGEWYAGQLNQFRGGVRLLVPRLDSQVLRRLGLYHEALPAQQVLRRTLIARLRSSETCRLQEHHLTSDDPRFSEAIVRAFREASAASSTPKRAQQMSVLDAIDA